VHFGRELNATDDRMHFTERGGVDLLPVLEGKLLRPFAVDTDRAERHIAATTARRLLGSRRFTRPRLAYRDVAAPTNRLTLIAAILPGNVVTTHTLFCLRDAIDASVQQFLCGIFNSFVANYLVRTRVTTHVNVSIVEHLPVPRPSVESSEFRDIVALSTRLSVDASDAAASAELQGSVARLYGLTAVDFQHVLETFPLVSATERSAAMRCFLAKV
jgi:hypothetical protein